jgi:hypothetical protein
MVTNVIQVDESKCPSRCLRGLKSWACDHLLGGIVVSNPAGASMSVSHECFVLCGEGLCVGLITLPEKSRRM